MFFLKLLVFVFLIIFLLEIIFRLLLIINGIDYPLSPRLNKKNFSIIDHPYLPYVLKANSVNHPRINEDQYPLHKGKHFLPSLKCNDLGFNTGKYGDEKIEIPKPKNIKRIVCLGASTTGNYIGNTKSNRYTSYPLELEKYLKMKNNNKNIQVVNCGIGGANSADLLVRYSLQIIDMEPDILIIYHGYNDIYNYLTKGFKSDYSHSLKGL